METPRLLVRYECADGCGPHPRCLACGTLTCVHVLAFICATPNLDADIQALPRNPQPASQGGQRRTP